MKHKVNGVLKVRVPAPFLYVLAGNTRQAAEWIARKSKVLPTCSNEWTIPIGIVTTAADIMALKSGSVVLLVGQTYTDRTDWAQCHQALAHQLCEIYTAI